MPQFVLTLAEKTGWSEDFILNELNLSRALQYRHCILRQAGYWTVPASEDAAAQLEKIRHLAPLAAPAEPLTSPASEDAVADWLRRHGAP